MPNFKSLVPELTSGMTLKDDPFLTCFHLSDPDRDPDPDETHQDSRPP